MSATDKDPQKELAQRRAAASQLKRRQYEAYRNSIVRDAKEKGFELTFQNETARWVMTDIATGKRQRNDLVLGDGSTFSLENAATWLKKTPKRQSR